MPDEWGARHRQYGPATGKPGPRDPSFAAYTIPFMRVVATGEFRGRRYKRSVLAMFAQGGKSEALLDIIGERMHNAPAPILYVGPNKQFLNEQWNPRLEELLEVPVIKERLSGRRMTVTRKVVSGQPLRLAHAGSSTALKSDPAALAVTDEADELMANVKGQGDPIGLIDARGDTYADFHHAVVSTPSRGPKAVKHDPESGFDFWEEQAVDEIESKVWRLWQEGTRHHYAVPCPHCRTYFIPRFECLDVGTDWRRVSPAEARERVKMIPPCGCVIDDDPEVRAEWSESGRFVAPGETVDSDGVVTGEARDSDTCSFWASGLVGRFKSWGDHAARYVEALRTGDQETIKTVVNAGFGELWSPVGGDVPEWEEVKRLALPYARGDVPHEAVFLTCGADVQKNRLVYVTRAWGPRAESWLVDEGELWGETQFDDVWADFHDLIMTPIGGVQIARVFIDSGFRPGKKDSVPEHKVYEFARRHPRLVYATKGFDTRQTPLSVNRIDVKPAGGKAKYGLDLVRLDADFMKSWVHERLRWPEGQPGGWHLHQDVTEAYCRQIVSEARVKKPGGGHQWIAKYRDNHFLDAEAMAYAAAYMIGVHRLSENARRPDPTAPRSPQRTTSDGDRPAKRTPGGDKRGGGFLGGGGSSSGTRRSGWL